MEHEQPVEPGSPAEFDAGDSALEKNTNLENIVLAMLFASEEPVSVRKFTSVIEDAPADDIREALERWRTRFDEDAWSIRLEQVAGGYQISTRPDYAVYVSRLYQGKRKFRLSRAGLETLAIIAYKQPVTRAEIENVRGVGSGGVVANLMERSLIRITGKAKVLGAPFLYGTTPEFLEYLGLNSLGDLPSLAELETLLEKEAYPEDGIETSATAPGDSDAPVTGDAVPDSGEEEGEGEGFVEAMAAMTEAAKTLAGAASVLKSEGKVGGEPASGAEGPDVPASDIPTVEFDKKEGEAAAPETESPGEDESAANEENDDR